MALLKYLFGHHHAWVSDAFEAVDDRVRGGSSQSFLDIVDGKAHFHGNLDTATLGGAGFASQRAVFSKPKKLGEFDGLLLKIAEVDNMTYTVILKNDNPSRDPETGRVGSSISYEFDFTKKQLINEHTELKLYIPWASFMPTYRGREANDAEPLNPNRITSFSFMTRSFFDSQHGKFSLTVGSVSALKPQKAECTTDGSNAIKRSTYKERLYYHNRRRLIIVWCFLVFCFAVALAEMVMAYMIVK